MTRLTDEKIHALLALEEEATPADWQALSAVNKRIIIRANPKYGDRDYVASIEWGGQEAHDRFFADGDLLVAARNNIRALCEELLAAREIVKLADKVSKSQVFLQAPFASYSEAFSDLIDALKAYEEASR